MVPAQGVGSTGALIQRKRTGVCTIPSGLWVLVVLHRILRVLILVILGGHPAFLLCMRDLEHRHEAALGASSVCGITLEGS